MNGSVFHGFLWLKFVLLEEMNKNIIHTDVAIIGSGLAGLSAARQLSRNGDISVVLVAPPASTKNNPTRLTFKDTISRHNLEDAILNEYDAFHLITVNNYRSTHHFVGKPLLALDYLKACQIIRLEIYSKPNIKFISTKAIGLKYKADYLEILLQNSIILRAKLLIDASSKAHFTISQFENQLPSLYSHSYGLTFENSRDHPLNESFFMGASQKYGSGGGWFYPLNGSRASLGIAIVNHSPRFPGKELKENFQKLLEKFSPFSHFLREARAEKFEVGTIPIEHLSKIFYNRILIIGDAAGHATPWMCMGVEPALTDGMEVAGVARRAIDSDNYSRDILSQWQKIWEVKNNIAYEKMKQSEPKLWFVKDEVWDFIVQYDLNNLGPDEFLERMRYNAHLMSKFTSFQRWMRFKVKKSLRC